jgi:hypothetical protein
MPDERTTATIQKVAAVGAGLVAGWLVHRLVDVAWRRAVGHPTPTADDEDTPFAELVLATAITGALVALIRLVTTRGTAVVAARLRQP